jgi:hypothetical protein
MMFQCPRPSFALRVFSEGTVSFVCIHSGKLTCFNTNGTLLYSTSPCFTGCEMQRLRTTVRDSSDRRFPAVCRTHRHNFSCDPLIRLRPWAAVMKGSGLYFRQAPFPKLTCRLWQAIGFQGTYIYSKAMGRLGFSAVFTVK